MNEPIVLTQLDNDGQFWYFCWSRWESGALFPHRWQLLGGQVNTREEEPAREQKNTRKIRGEKWREVDS